MSCVKYNRSVLKATCDSKPKPRTGPCRFKDIESEVRSCIKKAFIAPLARPVHQAELHALDLEFTFCRERSATALFVSSSVGHCEHNLAIINTPI